LASNLEKNKFFIILNRFIYLLSFDN
jgi:hypothetical protein